MNNVLVLKLGLAQSPFFFPQVLTSHSCSEEGLEDAANVLLQLSRGDPGTRDTVLKLLLNGARHLGYTLCKQIGNNKNKVPCLSETFHLGVTSMEAFLNPQAESYPLYICSTASMHAFITALISLGCQNLFSSVQLFSESKAGLLSLFPGTQQSLSEGK